jgi:hypothetical protein
MENQKTNFKFSFGALLGVIVAVWSIASCVLIGVWPINDVILNVLSTILSILVLMKKRGLTLVVPTALMALIELTSISFGQMIYTVPPVIELTRISFGQMIYTAQSVLSLITYICLVVLALDSMKSDGSTKGKRAAVTGLIISEILGMTIFTAATILRYEGYIRNIPTIAQAILGGLALILIGLWIANPYKKEETAIEGDTPTSEFYISLGKHIVLMLCTFGIWYLIWIYKTTKYTNLAKGVKQRGPGAAILLYIFVPFYYLFWVYKSAQRIDIMARERGVQSDIAVLSLVLSLFIAIVPPIIMQDKINQTIKGGQAPVNPEVQTAESLEKYKELLDKGIITQEDYDAKKKQLLGL